MQPGDWVLIHVGFALARIDEAEAQATLRMLEGMQKAYVDELEAMARSEATSTSPGSFNRPTSSNIPASSNRDS